MALAMRPNTGALPIAAPQCIHGRLSYGEPLAARDVQELTLRAGLTCNTHDRHAIGPQGRLEYREKPDKLFQLENIPASLGNF